MKKIEKNKYQGKLLRVYSNILAPFFLFRSCYTGALVLGKKVAKKISIKILPDPTGVST